MSRHRNRLIHPSVPLGAVAWAGGSGGVGGRFKEFRRVTLPCIHCLRYNRRESARLRWTLLANWGEESFPKTALLVKRISVPIRFAPFT